MDSGRRSCSYVSISDLQKIAASKTQNFVTVKELLHRRIGKMQLDAAKRGKNHIEFEVPAQVFPHGQYNHEDMGRDIAYELNKEGYEIRGTVTAFTILWNLEETAKKDRLYLRGKNNRRRRDADKDLGKISLDY